MRQPERELAGVTVTSVEPYYRPGGDLGWSRSGATIRVEGLDGGIEFPARRWNEMAGVGAKVDVVVRRGFFDDGWDGRAVQTAGTPHSAEPAEPGAVAPP